MKKVLIVDDDVAVTNFLMVFLMQTGQYEPTVVNDSKTVPDIVEKEQFDAMLLDMDMPHLSGMDIIKHISERGIDLPVVVLTGVNDVDLAVKSLKLGVLDYLTKPVDDDHLLEVLNKAIAHGTTKDSIKGLPTQLKREDLDYREAFDDLRSQSPWMIRLFHQAEKMAAGDLCVFIFGERGTGKMSLAKAIHKASPRRGGPFTSVDAAAHDMEKFPREFFGANPEGEGKWKRAGFLEEADGGTLFINNIELLPIPVQIRLDRVIQLKEFYRESSPRIHKIDVRIIVASLHDLTEEDYRDIFSRDLLYHLMVNSLHLPPLRERREDIPILANDILQREARRMGKKVSGFTKEFMDLLLNYDFPGNVQELNDIVATSVINTESKLVDIGSLAHYMRDILALGTRTLTSFHPRKLKDAVREHVGRTLLHLGGDKVKAAVELGINPEDIEEILESD
ncbi:MAG: sigma-54-dependent Fis family transcriptional regulator [Phycisphaerae bacterium]|nr:sigma-54-dependent Fis family transcriptional regulator [Phycisphaerae bacterium]